MSLDVSLYATVTRRVDVLDLNVTHNLNTMAAAAGLYQVMWRPEEISVVTGRDAIPHLRQGLARLRAEPGRFKMLNPANGWGRYENLVEAAMSMLEACEKHPDGRLEVSR